MPMRPALRLRLGGFPAAEAQRGSLCVTTLPVWNVRFVPTRRMRWPWESSTGGMAREVGERLGEVGCALSSGSVGSLSIAPAATSDAANTPTTKHASRPQSGLGNAVAHVVRRRPPAPRRRRHPVPGHRDGRRLVPGRTRIAVYGTVLWSWWVISAPPQGGRIPTTSVVGLDVARTTQQPPGRAGGRACDQRRGERLPRSGASS